MKEHSERILIDKQDGLIVEILAKRDTQKQNLLVLWMVLWTVLGISLIYQLFLPENAEIKTFLLIWLAFWAYFEFKVIYAYRWRMFGSERIKVVEDSLIIEKNIGKRGMVATYDLAFIKNLKLVEYKETSLIKNFSSAYWNPSQMNIEFTYNGKSIYFGIELEKEEANKLVSTLKHTIKEKLQ